MLFQVIEIFGHIPFGTLKEGFASTAKFLVFVKKRSFLKLPYKIIFFPRKQFGNFPDKERKIVTIYSMLLKERKTFWAFSGDGGK